uniref:Sfi1 spindle body domain-containing protein n=1 Tax=Magallana gigas TaxID=29159 RepID=K1R776_MAGGI
MTSSVFLERNLGDLPVFDRGRRGSHSSRPRDKDQQNDTFLVSISPRKPMGVPEARGAPHPSVRQVVRRRLNFLDSEEEFQPTPGFDFTDKMAAFRELLKKDSARDAERNKKNFEDRYVSKLGRSKSKNGKDEEKEVRDGLPRSREARRLLSRLADEKLASMSYWNYRAQLHLESVTNSHSKQEKIDAEQKPRKSESKSDDYLNKFLSEKTSSRSSSKQARHQNDADLDKIPQKEFSTPQQTNNNKIPLCPQNPLQEPGLLLNDTMGSSSTLNRKSGKGSIQSNVPHYHPSYVSPKDPPSESIRSQSKQPNPRGLGLCEGVRTGEVVITKSRAGKTSQSSVRGTPQSASKEDGGVLTLQDLATSPSKSKRRKTRDRQKSEEKIRKNIRELKEDLNISDSSKENDKVTSKPVRKTSREEGERRVQGVVEGTDEPRMTGVVEREGQQVQTTRRAVFGPRHPETDSDPRRGAAEGGWRPPEGSVSGSVRSIGSQSSTIMAVELLRKLYNVDPTTRQDLVLKAKCFRRWLKNVQSMQSIDERNGQSGPESYVGGPPRGLSGLLGSALTETDSDDNALLRFPSDNPQTYDPSGVGLIKNTAEYNGTNFMRYDTNFGERRTLNEKVTTKVAPITKENLERHTQIVQSNVHPFSNVHQNEGPSAFTVVRPRPANHKEGDNETAQTPRSMVTRGNNTGQVVQSTDRVLYPYTQYDYQSPDMYDKIYSESTARVACVSACKVSAASKCVTDSARIARGLGRATNLVLPSVCDSFSQLLDTANYGVCLQSAEIFHRRRVQRDFFFKWKKTAAEHVIIRAADNLHRLHTLKKGMSAFKWAINRSKIMVDIYQNKLKGVLVTATFYKWRERASQSRQARAQRAFNRWRHFTQESQKVRYMQDSMDRKLLVRLMNTWKEKFQIRVKENTAHNHFRNQSLHKLLQEWKQAAMISREEYDQNLAQSQEHYHKNQLRHCFSHWHDLLLTERTVTAANHKLVRNAFVIWKTSWEHQVHYREEIHARIRHKILSTSLTCWRDNVAVLKKRREAAVVYLQRVLVRHSLHGWRDYTQHKKQLRKSVVQWKKFCHKRALLRLFNDTEPIRKQNLLQRMFQKWLSVKDRIESENQEVEQTRGILERSQLERHFSHWKAETLLRLRVRPLVQQRQALLLTESFKAWHSLVQQKKKCRENNAAFLKTKLQKSWKTWRRQLMLQAVEKDVRKKAKTSFVRKCLRGWREVIQRKKMAEQFHNQQLMKQTFSNWHYKAIRQMKERLATKEEQEYNNFLLKSYFNLWWSNATQQRRYEKDIIERAEENRKTQRIDSSFCFWRHHLRATLVAREHQKMLQRKLMVRVVTEWRGVADRCMQRAVHDFAVRIGLQSPEDFSGEALSTSGDSESADRLQLLTDMILASENTSGIHSPVASSTLGTPMKRLFSPALSRVSLDLDRSIPEMDLKPTLANTSFIDARFEMEQAVKTERMKTLVTTAVNRIQFWPVSIMFESWRDYTLHQRELNSLCKQAVEVVQRLRVKSAFRAWRELYHRETQCRQFREECLKRHVFEALQENKRIMKHKKQLSALAHGYRSLTVFRRIFPVWFEKAQELKHTRSVVHIWNTRTEEEQALLPVEDTLHNRLKMKTLRKCLAVWRLKFLQIDRLRRTYHKIIQRRFFEVWKEWAQRKAQLRRDSQEFSNQRIQSWAFQTWRIRQLQMTVIEQKVKVTQAQNMRQLIQSWHYWAKENKKRKLTSLIVTETSRRNLVARTFLTWREQTEKCQLIARRCQRRLMIRIVREWQEVTVWKREMKKKALSFQVKSYTRQVIKLFKVWQCRYLECVQQHEEHEAYIRRRVVEYGRHWKKQAQKARGRQLQQVFRNRQVASCFAKWKYGYERNVERENQLNKYIVRKNRAMLGTYLDNWKIKLLSNNASRHFNVKLLGTFFSEWHTFASESKQRRQSCAVYQRALEQRNLKSYFSYWFSLTQVQNDIKKHCHLKLQIRVLREWHIYAQRRRQLATLGSLLKKHVETNVLRRAWYTMKVQADYCQNLSETANKVLMEKNVRCVQRALSVWREQLNRIVAGRCYHHLLARRTARQWRGFVERKKEEREIERQKNEKAITHHNKHLCKLAFRALHNEVKVKLQLERHKLRLQVKYGGIWKHRVDLMYTAICVVFLAWKEVCFDRIDKVRKSVQFFLPPSEPPMFKPSQLPTPVSRYQGKVSRKSSVLA